MLCLRRNRMGRAEFPSFSGDWLKMLLRRRVVLLCWVQMAGDPMLGVVGDMVVVMADMEEDEVVVVDIVSATMVEVTTAEKAHKIEVGMIIATEEIIAVVMVDKIIEVDMILVMEEIIAVVMVDTTEVVLQMEGTKNNINKI